MIKVGIVGGTGYTGVELLRILLQHPEVNIKAFAENLHDFSRHSNHQDGVKYDAETIRHATLYY